MNNQFNRNQQANSTQLFTGAWPAGIHLHGDAKSGINSKRDGHMKKASVAAVLVLAGWFGSPMLRAQPGVPEKPAVVHSSTAGAEPYGNGVAFAILVIGGMATLGRKLASDMLVRYSAGNRGARVIEFPSRALTTNTARDGGTSSRPQVCTTRSPQGLRRVK